MTDKLTPNQMHRLAVQALTTLHVHPAYIDAFKNDNVVTLYQRFAGFYATADNGLGDIEDTIHRLQDKHNILIYAATEEILCGMHMWTFLYVSPYKSEMDYTLHKLKDNNFVASAYAYNIDEPHFSEFGDVVIQSFGGGLRRVD